MGDFKRNGPGCQCGCGASGGAGISLPGCFCAPVPASLACTVTFGPGETAATYGGQYQDATILYYPAGPPYLAYVPVTSPGFFSTTSWPGTGLGTTGNYFFYYFYCDGSLFTLGVGNYRPGGAYNPPGPVWRWPVIGAGSTGNSCSPFLLVSGVKQPVNAVFNGKFVVSG